MVIDKDLLVKSELPFYQFIVISALYHNALDLMRFIVFPSKSMKETLSELQELQYIKILGEDYSDIELRKKSYDLFGSIHINLINFDEFWDEFPTQTPSGKRSLRPDNKLWRDKPTRDYLEAKKKYLTVVKTVSEHEEIVKILKSKNEHGSYEDKEYENGIIVYINQRKWQKDVRFLKLSSNNNTFIQKV